MGISLAQYKQLQHRLGGAGRAPMAVLAPAIAPRPEHKIILGVDPSLRGTGFGVIHNSAPQPAALTLGVISCPATWDHSRCLAHIAATLRDVVRKHRPTVCVIEGLFYAQNLKTALALGQARGAAITVIAEAGLEIFEIAPRKVKQAIVGYGAAQKSAVAKMVQRLLKLPELPGPDAADALALALAFSRQNSRYSLNAPKRV